MKPRLHIVGVAALSIPMLLVGCGPRSRPVDPDEMSAAGHLRAADKEESLAREHDSAYMTADPGPAPPTLAVDPAADRPVEPGTGSGPHEGHLLEAGRHRDHAAAHRTAAASLERFESSECSGIEPEVRASCPLLGPIETIENIPRGVRLRFAAGTWGAEVVTLMRCHVAFARTRGWPAETECSLYLRGVIVTRSPDRSGVDLTADDAGARTALRKRARTLYGASGH